MSKKCIVGVVSVTLSVFGVVSTFVISAFPALVDCLGSYGLVWVVGTFVAIIAALCLLPLPSRAAHV
jgi:hypothetical protein